MPSRSRFSVILGLLVLASASPVLAQQHPFVAFGLGWGSATITCSLCPSSGKFDGTAMSMQVGAAETPHTRLVFGYDEWWHTGESGWDRITENLTGSLLYYPWTTRRGLFAEGGLGFTVAKVGVTDSTGLRRHGLGLTVATGYDLAPRRPVSPTLRLAFSYGSIGNIYYPLGSSSLYAKGWKHEVVSLGLALTYHPQPGKGT